MKFFKENSYDIVRLMVNQLGITVFSLMLYFSAAMLGDTKVQSGVQLGVSVFSTLFYLALIYTATWDMGAKDRIRVDAGRTARIPAKGARLALFANVPNFLLAVLSLLGKGIYMLSGVAGFDGLFAVANLILRFGASMYLGMLQAIFSPLSGMTDLFFLLQSVGFVLLPGLCILAAHIGYTMGFRCIRIGQMFSARSKEDPQKKD